MSVLEVPLGHRAIVEGLWRARNLGRLPHALLLEGPEGVGKFLAAQWLTQGLFCTRAASAASDGLGPCGECGPCKRIAARTHPDYFVLDPIERELEVIPVGAIASREDGEDPICDFLSLRPMEGGLRVVLIREFERANVQAQNALLKTLEEPGQATLLLLETSRADLLLETVRSRCVTVRFQGLDAAEAQSVLAARGLHGDEAASLARWAEGSPGRALALHREGALGVRELLANVLNDELDALEGSRLILEHAGEFQGKTPTAQLRARARAALDLCCALLLDGLRQHAGLQAEQLAHGDLLETTQFTETALRSCLERCVALRGEVELNLAPEGILDRALLLLSAARTRRAHDHARR